MDKQAWLHWAEIIDSWRVIPRLFLLACFLWVVNTAYILLIWYIHLPAIERSVEASGFAFGVFSAELAFLKMVYESYTRGSRDWNRQPLSSSLTSTSVQTIGPQP